MNDRRLFLQSAGAAAIGAFSLPWAARAARSHVPLKSLPYIPIEQIPNHRQWMRDIVIALSDYCKKRRPDFTIIVRNAPELLIKEKREADWEAARDPDGSAQGRYGALGSVDGPYLGAIDGILIDGAFFGYDHYEDPTRPADAAPLLAAAALMRKQGKGALAIDYCKEPDHRTESAAKAAKANLLPYIDQDGDMALDRIPAAPPATENARHVMKLADARNFLPLLTANGFQDRDRWLDGMAASNHDLLLIDPFFHGVSMTLQEAKALRYKRLGSRRMVLATLPVGVTAIDRFYWQKGWHVGNPDWIAAPDPEMIGRFVTAYWQEEWKTVLGNYVTGLCDLGIDGVLLDGVDAYLFFEAMMPF